MATGAEALRKCKKGLHWMTPANTLIQKQYGGRNGVQMKCRACRYAAKRKREKHQRELLTARQRAYYANAAARGLPPDDPRHGSQTGALYWKCQCELCLQAKADYQRLFNLKRKAARRGIKLPKDRVVIGLVDSLDATAEKRFGMDRIMVGSEWDDPTGEAACG